LLGGPLLELFLEIFCLKQVHEKFPLGAQYLLLLLRLLMMEEVQCLQVQVLPMLLEEVKW
jgi:hypothetical protein